MDISTKMTKVALIGNPNTGKTSLFNQLTGLTQKVGNYPGVTVDKKQGICKLSTNHTAEITDLPGTYSINPTSIDESIVLSSLLFVKDKDRPDVIVVLADIENLKRNLLLFAQVKDLEIPTVLALNMADQLDRKGISIDIPALENELKTKVVLISARKNQGIDELKVAIENCTEVSKEHPLFSINHLMDTAYFKEVNSLDSNHTLFELWLMITQRNIPLTISNATRATLERLSMDVSKVKKQQHKETIHRYRHINAILKRTYEVDRSKGKDVRGKLDRVFTHKVGGYLIFVIILLVMFQSIFDWSSGPMDFIDAQFSNLGAFVRGQMDPGVLTDLITEGIIPGIGGVVIFIPQIAILSLFIAVLEETGYMSRVVFLMDKIMRRYGMSGKSIIPLISGTACAIPAVMATRTISGWKERLITILVTPFTTCSARLPVYAILIALVIPDVQLLGFYSLQGFTLLCLYALGFLTAMISAAILHKVLKVKSTSFFVAEMPDYKVPSLKNVGFEVVEKAKVFVLGAGKIILALSVVLWFLASNGPKAYREVDKTITEITANKELLSEEVQQQIAAAKLENSYIGMLGKTIEPIIRPLGYDWKIGIALITSFAAREVFVGTLATIYSVESDDEDMSTIKERMQAEIHPDTGEKRFNLAVGLSLLVFYAFAMQCMGTLAIVKRETKSWKWPLIQLVGMGILAYVAAFITFTIFS